MGQVTGQESAALNAGAPDVFLLSEVDGQIIFTRDASGAVEGLIRYRDGRDRIAPKK